MMDNMKRVYIELTTNDVYTSNIRQNALKKVLCDRSRTDTGHGFKMHHQKYIEYNIWQSEGSYQKFSFIIYQQLAQSEQIFLYKT